MRHSLINFLKTIGLYNVIRWLYTRVIASYWRILGVLINRNRLKLAKHQSEFKVHKLHLGCGLNYLPSWLNTDIMPDKKRIYLDITKKFTFDDGSFDYIFTEHVIEHMPYLDGKNLIQESFRTLKSGGVLRLVTPDINFLIGLYQDPDKKIHKDYIEWNSDLFIGSKAPHHALSVVNNYVRDWGHEYIYDAATLIEMLNGCGFVDIAERKLGESDFEELQSLENESRHPEGFLALESLVLEAKKP